MEEKTSLEIGRSTNLDLEHLMVTTGSVNRNDAIHQLAIGRNSSLRFTITPMNGSVASFKIYHQFYVFGEDQNYRLQLANPGNGNLEFTFILISWLVVAGSSGRHFGKCKKFISFTCKIAPANSDWAC
uniref:Uncharacterized protein n=1 Tax=Magallana gigas TaxID=29159 RepID=K1RIL7_MAGGI